MPADQLLAYLAESLSGEQQPDGGSAPIGRSVSLIERTLRDNVEAGRHAVIVIDEAQDLTDAAALETVRLLLNFGDGLHTPLTLLLVGQPSFLPVLDRASELDERLAVKCFLRS